MQTIHIKTPAQAQAYDIIFQDDFMSLLAALKKQIDGRNFLVVSDENVREKTDFLKTHLDSKDISLVSLPPGEQEKNWNSIDTILKAAFEAELDRHSVLVSVGGGVIGDMTGFAASIFMRGIPFIQVPTTLLAMVDASIGGKTGIDCEYGKNLIGAMQQPEAIFVCDKFLNSLPDIEIKNGLAEMVKHGVVSSPEHFADLEALAKKYQNNAPDEGNFRGLLSDVFTLAPASMNIKKAIVEADELERGKRKFLNFATPLATLLNTSPTTKFLMDKRWRWVALWPANTQ